MSRITLHNYIQARRYFQWLVTNFSQEIQDAMIQVADDFLVPQIQQQIESNDQVFKWELHNSIVAERVARGNTPSIKVGTHVDYAKNVEEGSAPRAVLNTSEFKRLIDWAEYKHQVRGRAARAIAAAAALKIEKTGNRKRSFLMKTWNRSENRYWKMVFQKVNESLNRGP